MISYVECKTARDEAAIMLQQAGIVISEAELWSIEVADFGLSELRIEGAQTVTLVSTDRVTLRVIVLFPGQTLPEHRHTGFGSYEGKQETIRVIYGELFIYLPGAESIMRGTIPSGKEAYYTVRSEKILSPNDSTTIPVDTKHWFQAGKSGAVLYSVSTMASDAHDPFTNPDIVRETVIK